MNKQEAAALLAVAAAFDNRKPDADAATAWSVALFDIRFEDARNAVVKHYRSSTEWLMPQMVVAEVKRVRNKRLADYGDPIPPPSIDPDDTKALHAWRVGALQDIANGNPPPRPVVVAAVGPAEVSRGLLALRKKADNNVREGLDAQESA